MTVNTPNSGVDYLYCTAASSATYPAPCVNTSDAKVTARSHHPGGVVSGLADGSVSFATDSVDLAIWQAYGSIQAGEVVNPL